MTGGTMSALFNISNSYGRFLAETELQPSATAVIPVGGAEAEVQNSVALRLAA